MLMLEDDRESVKARFDCRELAEQFGWRIVPGPRQAELRVRCGQSAHYRGDLNPSMRVKADGFVCYGCGWSGDAFTMIAHYEGLDVRQDFPQVIALARELAHAPNPQVFRSHIRRQPERVFREEDQRITKTACLEAPAPRLDYASALGLDAERWLRALWKIIGELELGPEALSWLERRRINPQIAYALGCRDWSMARDELTDFLKSSPDEVLISLGMARCDEGRGFEWAAPWRAALMWGARGAGLAIPTTGIIPLSWRWRLATPLNNGAKTLAMFPPPEAGALLSLPLGIWLHPDEECPEHGAWLMSSDRAYGVVIVEGEPDYLSAWQHHVELAKMLGVERIEVLGLCSISSFASSPLASEVLAMVRRASCVCVAVHYGPEAKSADVMRLGEHALRRLKRGMYRDMLDAGIHSARALERLGELILDARVDDVNDLNALDQRGAFLDHFNLAIRGHHG